MQKEHARPANAPRTQPLAVWRLERTRRTRPSARRLEQVTARLLALLEPGGFLALAQGARIKGGAFGDVVRTSQNPDNLAHLPRQQGQGGRAPFTVALAEIVAGYRRLLAPAGFLVLVFRKPKRARAAPSRSRRR